MILITTPGNVGREAARLLAEASAPVRLLARHPDKVADLQAMGVEVVVGDLDDDGSVAAAMRDVSAVILVSPALVEPELRIVAAAEREQVGHVVKITSKASPDSPIERRRGQSEIEAGLAASGLNHTLLRGNGYMQNFLMLAPAIVRMDSFGSSVGDGRIGLVDARDIAAAAARIAGAPEAHVGKTYWLTGPQRLSYAEVAEIFTQVLGRPIAFASRTFEEDKQAMIAAGVPAPVAEMNAQAFSLIAEGDADWQTDTVREILGRDARSFEQFASDHAGAFSPAPTPT